MNGEFIGLRLIYDHMVARPLDAVAHISALAGVIVFTIEQIFDCWAIVPLDPTLGVHDFTHLALHEHHARIGLPWAAELGLHRRAGMDKVVTSRNVAEMEGEPGNFNSGVPILGGDMNLVLEHYFMSEINLNKTKSIINHQP
jgi:hypothetical protein